MARSLDHRKGVPAPRGDRHVGDGPSKKSAAFPSPPARHDSGRRPDPASGKNKPTLSSALKAVVVGRRPTSSPSKTRSSYQIPGRQPDADQRQDQAHLRERVTVDSASGIRTSSCSAKIRDGEGGPRRIAMQAAQTGHLVAVDAAHRRCAVGRHAGSPTLARKPFVHRRPRSSA